MTVTAVKPPACLGCHGQRTEPLIRLTTNPDTSPHLGPVAIHVHRHRPCAELGRAKLEKALGHPVTFNTPDPERHDG